jgi:hypothetical protein
MQDFQAARIKKMVIHLVGNKGLDESLILAENHARTLNEQEEEQIRRYFLKPFQKDDYHCFSHHTKLDLNEVYGFVNDMFLTPVNFIESSKQIAKHLYESLAHPRIKGGELYVVVFEDVYFDGEPIEAIGIFKSEQKSSFLNITPDPEQFDYSIQKGIDIEKLDKGCVIFRTGESSGYKMLIHDRFNKNDEAQFWKDDFLGAKPINNEFEMTKNYMSMCKSFVMEKLPEEFEVDRTLQIELLNRSSGYFSSNEEIDQEEFAASVLEQPALVESFHEYKSEYTQNRSIEIEDSFQTSKSAVKQGKKDFKSVIKLDKNFHLYVHGNRDLVEQGFDEERGMKYYKVFYNEEK